MKKILKKKRNAMTHDELQSHFNRLQVEFKDFFDKYAPTIVGKTAVSFFKQRFQIEGWERAGDWQQVQRRMSSWTRGGKTIKNPYNLKNGTVKEIDTDLYEAYGNGHLYDKSATPEYIKMQIRSYNIKLVLSSFILFVSLNSSIHSLSFSFNNFLSGRHKAYC